MDHQYRIVSEEFLELTDRDGIREEVNIILLLISENEEEVLARQEFPVSIRHRERDGITLVSVTEADEKE